MNLKISGIIMLNLLILSACGGQNECYEEDLDGFVMVYQSRGAALGYSPNSGLQLISEGYYLFKDLNRNGELDPYEDWRLSPGRRAADLASKMSVEQIAGLMLFSTHQRVPTDQWGWWPSTYEGQPTFDLAGLPPYAVSDTQKFYMSERHLRGFLMANIESPEVGARWSNSLQAFAEGIPPGIPVSICSDPRHETEARAEYNAGSGGTISLWPPEIGISATFDPEVAYQHGRVLAEEFRALGITTVLAPQIDLATEPRWSRFYGTFGEHSRLAADMTRAYIDGCQTSPATGAWGSHSVNAMAKHWPGGGAEEGGRDAHFSSGKYCVYPGGNIEESMSVFTRGAFRLDGGTRCVSAVMPYYTISYGVDPSGANVGNSFSEYLINDCLREQLSYDGVVCTDWGIVLPYEGLGWTNGRPWGVENLSSEELHLKVIEAGCDQFGGANDNAPIVAAYEKLCLKIGREKARERFEQSARRLLVNMFRVGLFENPYVDVQNTVATLGCAEYMDMGYRAQQKSVIMLKNHNSVLPVRERRRVYLPKIDGQFCTDSAVVSRYYDVSSCPDSADFALVFVVSPSTEGGGYSGEDRACGGNGYVPISLQYEDYTADSARVHSIAGGDPMEDFTDRSFRGKTVKCPNGYYLDLVLKTRELMGDRPVVTGVSFLNPFVPSSIEKASDALLLLPWVQHQTALDIISGAFEPCGLLPLQLPCDMTTVEKQLEDVPLDMECHVDADGNVYDFAFGLNWSGVIKDKRVRKYAK